MIGETAGTDDLHEAMEVVRSLSEVMPQAADQKIGGIYDDIQATLRVPFVNQVFRLLANNAVYLDAAWRHVGPIAGTRAFESAAETLRGDAALAPVPEAGGVDWAAVGDVDRVRRFTASIQYVLPKLMLIGELLDPDRPAAGGATDLGPAIPRGIVEGAEQIEMVDPEEVAGPVRVIFTDIMNWHGHPTVATYFRSLGQWPDLLQAVWTRLRPLVGDSGYVARRAVLTRRAAELSAALDGGGAPQPPASCEAVLILFRRRTFPDLLIDVTTVRNILDPGGTMSPFPQAGAAGLRGSPRT